MENYAGVGLCSSFDSVLAEIEARGARGVQEVGPLKS